MSYLESFHLESKKFQQFIDDIFIIKVKSKLKKLKLNQNFFFHNILYLSSFIFIYFYSLYYYYYCIIVLLFIILYYCTILLSFLCTNQFLKKVVRFRIYD